MRGKNIMLNDSGKKASTKVNEDGIVSLTYNKLLNDCNSKNNIETQLKVAKFDNNVNLITELQKQLNDVNTEIDVFVDEKSLYSILQNVINNSIKWKYYIN
jgi:hypothetical protein